MTRLWLAPDVEPAVVQHLKKSGYFQGIKIGTKKPPLKNTEVFIQIFQTGGTPRDIVTDKLQLTVTCWHSNAGEAMTLARKVRAVLEQAEHDGLLNGIPCYRALPIGASYPDPDPVTGQARATTTFEIALRGTYKRKQ